MCQTFRSSYERVLGDWAKWMEQTGIKQTMWELWVGRTQPEKPWQGLELNLSLRIGTFLILCNFNFRRENVGCVVSIRSDWRKEKKNREGALWKAEQNVWYWPIVFFCEMKWDSWCTLCLLSVGQLSSPPHLLWTVFKSVASDSTFSLISHRQT